MSQVYTPLKFTTKPVEGATRLVTKSYKPMSKGMKLVLIEEYKQLLVNYQKDNADIPPGNTTLKIMLAG